jgi:catechol O-methyltransferase
MSAEDKAGPPAVEQAKGEGEKPATPRSKEMLKEMQTPPNALTIPLMILNEIGSLVYNMGKTKEIRIVEAAKTAPAGEGKKIVDAIDKFCHANWMMNLGDIKGDEMDQLLKDHGLDKIKVAVEFGGYCGYSAVRLGNVLPKATKIYTVESTARFADAQTNIIAHAEMTKRVEQFRGYSGEFIQKMIDEKLTADFVFMDHHTSCYVEDVQKMLKHNLLAPGCLIIADNVLFPGAPEYKAWMTEQEGLLFENRTVATCVEYRPDLPDELFVSKFVGAGKSIVFVKV